MDKQTQVDGAVGSDGGVSQSVGQGDGKLVCLAEAINKRWPHQWFAKTRFDGLSIEVHMKVLLDLLGGDPDKNEACVKYSTVNGELHNGSFIVWGLDRLIEMGHDPVLCQNYRRTKFIVSGDIESVLVEGEGATRAEAVANALTAALAVAPARAPGLSNAEGTADQSDSTKEDV